MAIKTSSNHFNNGNVRFTSGSMYNSNTQNGAAGFRAQLKNGSTVAAGAARYGDQAGGAWRVNGQNVQGQGGFKKTEDGFERGGSLNHANGGQLTYHAMRSQDGYQRNVTASNGASRQVDVQKNDDGTYTIERQGTGARGSSWQSSTHVNPETGTISREASGDFVSNS